MISTGKPMGIQPFSVSHVVLSDPTSTQGHEERGRTERRGVGTKQRCAANGWQWRKRGDGDKKRTDERDDQGIKADKKKHLYKMNKS